MVVILSISESKIGQMQITIPKKSNFKNKDNIVILKLEEYLKLGGKL